MQEAFKKLHSRVLFIHGLDDRDVPVSHSETMWKWAMDNNLDAKVIIVQGAGHTFNTKHPFEGPTPQLDEAINSINAFIG